MPSRTADLHATSWRIDLPVLLVAVVWGSSYLATRSITTPDTVLALLLLRFAIAVPGLAVAVRGRLRHLGAQEVGGGAVLGLILAGVFLFETYGVVHTTATNAGLIISLTMILTPLGEAALHRRRPSGPFLAAAVVSVAGVALLTQGTGFSAPSLGDLLMLLAAVVRTANVLAIHRLPSVRRTDDGVLTLIQLTTVVAVFAVLSPLVGTPPWRLAAALSGWQWLDLIYLALGCTLFAFLVQLWAIRRTSPSRVSLLLGTEPLWAAVVGVTLAGDRLGPAGWVGAGLVLVGTAWGRSAASPAPPTVVVAAAD